MKRKLKKITRELDWIEKNTSSIKELLTLVIIMLTIIVVALFSILIEI